MKTPTSFTFFTINFGSIHLDLDLACHEAVTIPVLQLVDG